MNPLILVAIVFIIFILLDSLSPVFSSVFIFLYFLFAYVNVQGTSNLATFYLFGALFVIVVQLTKAKFAPKNSSNVQAWSFKGYKFPFISFFVGVLIFGIMFLLQSKVPNAIIGVPSLSVSSMFFAKETFYASLIAVLGIIENRIFFSVYELLKFVKFTGFIPIMGAALAPILPIFLTGLFFAFFHISAYGAAVGSMVFAAATFTIWIVSYIWLNDDLAANIAHYVWNAVVILSGALAIVGGL